MRNLLIALTATILSACAIPDGGVFAINFAPLTASDGTKTWRLTAPWSLNSDELALTNVISTKMGESHWCSSGWQITSREKVSGLLMAEGRCL